MDPVTLQAIGSTIGTLISIGSARSSERAARRYRNMALALQRDNLNLSKQELMRIENIYGGVLKSLGNYYSGNEKKYGKFLKSPLVQNKIRTNTANILQQYGEVLKDVDEQLGQLGIGPAAKAAVQKELGLKSAAAQAKARADAPMNAAKEMLGFAQLGEQARVGALNATASARNTAAQLNAGFSQQQLDIVKGANIGGQLTSAFDAWSERLREGEGG